MSAKGDEERSRQRELWKKKTSKERKLQMEEKQTSVEIYRKTKKEISRKTEAKKNKQRELRKEIRRNKKKTNNEN
jgi:hypothetical protein